MQYCYLNGEILPETDARVSILDIGLLRGFGIYEAMATLGGHIFRFDDHATRFRKSAGFLGITIPLSDTELKNTIHELIEKNNLSRARTNIKCILTGGTAIDGIVFDPAAPTFYIFLEAWKPLDDASYRDGAVVITHEHLRQYPQYKTTNYITAVNLQKKMRDAGALEVLYTWHRNVLECATSNFFIVKDGVLVTAKEHILAGVTRNVVIELAQAHNIPVQERAYTLNELNTAEECFLTSSFKDVVPVVRVDTATIADGHVGAVTTQCIQLFADYFAQQTGESLSQAPPYSHHRSQI